MRLQVIFTAFPVCNRKVSGFDITKPLRLEEVVQVCITEYNDSVVAGSGGYFIRCWNKFKNDKIPE
jgi:hypothetical protein